jgi:hypothetical protein
MIRQYFGISQLTDITTLTDQLSQATGKPLTDTFVLTDILSKVLTSARNPSDVLAFTDMLVYGRNVPKPISDALSWFASLTFHYAGARSFSDIMNLVESLNAEKSGAATRSLTDTLILTDSFAKVLTGKRTFAEAIQLSDLLMKGFGAQLVDVLTWFDNLGRFYQGQAVLLESVNITDTLARQYAGQVTLNDILIITENLVAVYTPGGAPTTVTITIQDLFNLNDLLGILYVPVGVTPTGGGGFTLPVTVASLVQIQLAAIPRIATLDYITANPMSLQLFLFKPSSVLQVLFTGTNGNRNSATVNLWFDIRLNGQSYMTTQKAQQVISPGVPVSLYSWLLVDQPGTYQIIPHAEASPQDPTFTTATLPTQTITVEPWQIWITTIALWAIILGPIIAVTVFATRAVLTRRREEKEAEEE